MVKKMKILAIGLCLVAFLIPQNQTIAQTKFGELFCTAMRDSGLVIRCSSLNSEKVVAAFIHTNSSEAATMCSGIVKMIRNYKTDYRGWRLKIYSPYDRSVPLSTCSF